MLYRFLVYILMIGLLLSPGSALGQIENLVPFMSGTTPIYEVQSLQVFTQPNWKNTETTSKDYISAWERFIQSVKKDPIANSLAIITLVGMIFSIILILSILIRTVLDKYPVEINTHIPGWLVLLLILIGIGVAGYLSFIEVSDKQAVCGPVGKCNEVQNSSYAEIFGILPIGILGLIGYISMLATWVLQTIGPTKYRKTSSLLLWVLSLFGVVFSVYLTYLEPFVIGATCLWCLSSAIIITAILWAATPKMQEVLLTEDIIDEELLE